MEGYRVYLHLDLLEAMPKQRVARERILRFLRTLGADPFTAGDFSQQDKSLRTQQVKILGDHAITWWVAHPDKTVIIVDISLADQ